MALNGAEREDNFCHKSAVARMVCKLPRAHQAAMLCPLGCPVHQALLAAALANGLCGTHQGSLRWFCSWLERELPCVFLPTGPELCDQI